MDSTRNPKATSKVSDPETTPILTIGEEPDIQIETDETSLIICTAEDPGALFLPAHWDTSKEVIYQAMYDGSYFGYDLLDFSYHPVLLEKLPNLADGDAEIAVVKVKEGDLFMLDSFNVIQLLPPHTKIAEDGDTAINAMGENVVVRFGMSDWIRPAGCKSSDCAVPFVGNPVEIEQPGVEYKPVGCRDNSCLVDYDGGTVEMEQMVVHYSFRPDLVWSDGVKVVSADSVYAYELAQTAAEDEIQNLVQFSRIASYTALDDFTIEMKTTPGFLGSTYPTMFWPPLPSHLWSEYSYLALASGKYLDNMETYGPYNLEAYNPGETAVLTRNEFYFRADENLPYFDRVVYKFVGVDASVNAAALISGECDILDTSTLMGDQTEFLIALAETGMINAEFVTSTVWEHLDFGILHSDYDDGYSPEQGDRPDLFGDVRTRQAFAFCINRQKIVDTQMLGQSYVMNSYIPDEHPLYSPELKVYPFDTVRGSELLGEVGWIYGSDGIRTANGIPGIPDGTRLEVSLYTTSAVLRQNITEMIKNDLQKCGIEVHAALLGPAELFAVEEGAMLFGRNFDLAEFAWWTDVEPPCDLFLSGAVPSDENNWEGYNVTGYSNPDFDSACSLALSSLPGEEGYRSNHQNAQNIFSEDLPVLPLFQRIKMAAARVDLCGFILDPSNLTSTWNIENFSLDPQCK